jgi:hypothetical protein
MTARELRGSRSIYDPLAARPEDPLLRWEQKDLAATSKISLPAIKQMESVRGPLAARARTIDAIRAAFTVASVIFVEEKGEGPGVRSRKTLRQYR